MSYVQLCVRVIRDGAALIKGRSEKQEFGVYSAGDEADKRSQLVITLVASMHTATQPHVLYSRKISNSVKASVVGLTK